MLQRKHALEEEDYASRFEFCEQELEDFKNDADKLKLYVFSDEAIFHTEVIPCFELEKCLFSRQSTVTIHSTGHQLILTISRSIT